MSPMYLHLIKKPCGGGEQVGSLREDREHQAVGRSVGQVGRDAIARVREASNGGEGSLR